MFVKTKRWSDSFITGFIVTVIAAIGITMLDVAAIGGIYFATDATVHVVPFQEVLLPTFLSTLLLWGVTTHLHWQGDVLPWSTNNMSLPREVVFCFVMVVLAFLLGMPQTFQDDLLVVTPFRGNWLILTMLVFGPLLEALTLPVDAIKPQHKGDQKRPKWEVFRDCFYHHKTKEGTHYLHWGNMEFFFRGFGFGYPKAEIVVSDGDYLVTVAMHIGLFGFTIGTSHFPLLKPSYLSSTFVTGFYTCANHIVVSFWNDDMGHSRDWKGFSRLWTWMYLLRGTEHTESWEEECGVFPITTIPMNGFPQETVDIKVTKTHYHTTWSRSHQMQQWFRYNLLCLTEGALRVPGKGENSWDCDDDYGLDLSCSVDHSDLLPSQVAEYAAIHIHDARKRRG